MTEKANFSPYALAYEYAEHLGVEQQKGELEDAFKSRVAGILREALSYIAVHEAFSGRRYDDEKQGLTGPMAGTLGVLAQAVQGREY